MAAAHASGNRGGDRSRRCEISKKLSYNLRHNPETPLEEDGSVKLDSLLWRIRATAVEVCDVVENWSRNDYGNLRFEMTQREDRSFWIRATNGHSNNNVDEERVRAPPSGISADRTESHKQACQRVRASYSEPRRSTTSGTNLCVVCYSEEKTHALIPCGHKCLCKHCSDIISRGCRRCPLCLSNFERSIQIYD